MIPGRLGKRLQASTRAKDVAAPILLMLLILAGWEILVRVFEVPTYVLPPPLEIVEQIYLERVLIFGHLQVTLYEIVAGYLLACVVGFGLSVLIVYSKAFRRGVLPLIVASQTIPVIAIAPILVIWFGYNDVPRIIITALVAFFPLTVSFVTGLESLEPELINFFRSLNATGVQIFLKLRLPAALPNIFAGLKVATTLAVIGVSVLLALGYYHWRYWSVPWLAPNPIDNGIVWVKALLPGPAPPSIAVLPFASPGGDAAAETLAQGLSEDITTALGKVSDFKEIKVIAAASVQASGRTRSQRTFQCSRKQPRSFPRARSRQRLGTAAPQVPAPA